MDLATIAVVSAGAASAALTERLCACGLAALEVEVGSLGSAVGIVIVTNVEVIAPARSAVGLDVPILAMVEAAEMESALSAGCTDVALPSQSDPVILARISSLVSGHESDSLGREIAGIHEALVEIDEVLEAGAAEPDTMRAALTVARDVVGFERASLVANIESSERAFVVAATDDPLLQQFALGIWDYPEIRKAVHNAEAIVIADALRDPLTTDVAPKLRESGVRAIVVVPVLFKRRALGAIAFRKNTPLEKDIPRLKLSFAQLVAGRIGGYLRDSTVIQRLREQTHRISRASYEAERRLRTVESLKEHFEAAADGVFVVGDDAEIMFVNGVGERITGFARDALVGASLYDLILDEERDVLVGALAQVVGGSNLEAFDIHLSTTSGHPVCVSVSTSTVLSKSGAAILSFREVTQERALEIELRKTKEFLEKMIDSTVDGLIAADTEGTIILFNPGAERIFGYSAADVVGKIRVQQLYPEGVPRQVMRMLRADAHGGVGRLEQTRREILSRNGELVPVNMTASIIYEDGEEVATVGIFSDLRERIRIEQRLLKAQEKLELSEKRALVAQLAGTAAHELNQPLTSIMGYAQLVARQIEGQAAGGRAVDIILQEAERMAEIVRKIGRITSFETKEYVGGASIIDLDKSAPNPPDFGAPVEGQGQGLAPVSGEIRDTTKMAGLAPDDDASATPRPVSDTPTSPIQEPDSTRKTMRLSALVEVSPDESRAAQKQTLKLPRPDLTSDD